MEKAHSVREEQTDETSLSLAKLSKINDGNLKGFKLNSSISEPKLTSVRGRAPWTRSSALRGMKAVIAGRQGPASTFEPYAFHKTNLQLSHSEGRELEGQGYGK